MRIVVLDFETYYASDYTLSSMTTEAYVRDPRFEAHLLGFFWDDGRSYYATQPDIPAALAQVDWSDTAVVCHHAHFDGLILSHHYGVRPAFWFDTLSMARLMIGNHMSASLASLAEHFQLRGKQIDYAGFKGRRFRELDPTTLKHLGEGCVHDCEITWSVFQRLGKDFPRDEFEVVDMTVRMFTQPSLRADTQMLGKLWEEEERSKATALAALQINEAEVQSSARFAELLRAEGVEPDTKTSPKGKQIYAFAKTDQFMIDLQDSENPRLSALANARLGAKSTLLQSRAETLGWMASRGPLCVYLSAYAAHTTRWGGGDKTNFQNFPRGPRLRRAIMAPEGEVLGVVDKAQIECRMLNTTAGQENITQAFAQGRDLYSEGASKFYGRTITKADKLERHLGKTLELGCGYGMGAAKLRVACRQGALGGPSIILSEEEAKTAITSYRTAHPAVCGYWKAGETVLATLADRKSATWGILRIENGRIYLPNRAPLIYDTLEWHTPTATEIEQAAEEGWETPRPHWRYKTRKGWDKMYGAKLVEQTTQALARLDFSQSAIRIVRAGIPMVMTSHDEGVFRIKQDGHEAEALEFCRQEFIRPPAWLPSIPLDAEALLGERYAK